MKKIIGLLGKAMLYGSVATVLALLLGVGYVGWKLGFSQEKFHNLMAALYDIDIAEMRAKKIIAAERGMHEDVDYNEILRQRALKTLDHDLREQAIGKGLADLRLLQRDLMEERRRYDLLKTSFDAQLNQLLNASRENAIIELQLTLETIKPQQAKDHLSRMLPKGFVDGEFAEMNDVDRKAVVDVVTIMKAMPLDKRKKILAEFESDEDARMLAELLRLIRLGVPEVQLISDTRSELQEFNAN